MTPDVNGIIQNIIEASGALYPVLYTLAVAALLDTLTGLWAAYNSGTLSGEYVAEFLRSHVMQRIVPIMTGLLAGVAVGGTDNAGGSALIALSGASAAAYLLESVASIRNNLGDGSRKEKGLPTRSGAGVVLVDEA